MSAPSIAQALNQARTQGLDRVDAFALLGHVLQRERAWLITHDDQALTPAAATHFEQLCARRLLGEPVAYLVGEREFHGLRLAVSPAVLVPRPDTETLVDWALELLAASDAPPSPRVLDLGTGSGAIALAVRQACPHCHMMAVDLSPAALAQARANGERLGLPVNWLQGAWWQPVAGQRFDLVLSNPPYIAEGDPHLDALQHEPRMALTSGPDGLDDLRRIVAQATAHLQPGGHLLLEHGWDQAPAVQKLLAEAGLEGITSRADLSGQWRCTGGTQTKG
ncbi:MAG: peptide chain release factor N(5)-glutamine methyltransferase [Ideonella sp. MAG2]|nr:MAG: peptide chain release factor N(5)-glutamine methyltransferase [Ideonella sp. MAG2]